MLLRLIVIVLLLSSPLLGSAQINIQWEARLDGAGSFIDQTVDFELDASGNTYVTGSSYSGTSYDLVTVKYDSDGVELWRAVYGSAGIDEANALTIDSNNDVIITGYRFITGTDWDLVIVKYDGATGAELWSVIRTGSSGADSGEDVVVDGADNVIVVGTQFGGGSDFDIVTLKYSAAGVLIWSDLEGGTRGDIGKFVQVDDADNIYVGGEHEFTVGTTYNDFQLIKYNSAGVIQWNVTADSDFGKIDSPFAMTLDNDDNIIMAGQGFSTVFQKEDYLVIKFDNATGAVLWKSTYQGDAGALDVINAVACDGSNNVYVTGKSKSADTSEDFYTIAFDSDGVELWADRYTTEGLDYDEGRDIRVADSDTYVYVTGFSFYSSTNNDFTTIKYDAATGEREWVTIFDGPSSNSDQALKMKLDASENIFVSGKSHGGATNSDYSTIKYCQLTTTASPDTSVCDGGSVTLEATGGDDVTWEVLSGDAGSMSCTVCETMVATPDETTVYIVSSTSLSGCVDYDTVLVTFNEIPTVSIYNDTPLEFCIGGSVELYTDTYDSYDWSTGDATISTEVIAAGTVTLTVEDGAGCTNSASVVIATYDLPIVDVGDDISLCPEESVVLNATGALTYVWDEEPTLSSLLIANPTASPIIDTEYKVTGTDDNGCQNRDSLTVSLFDLPAVNAGADETVCIGGSVEFLATGATSYVWDAAPTLSSLIIPNPVASPTVLTEYFVTGTDDNGCTNRDSINVSVLSVPDIDAGIDTAVCNGGSVQLFASGGLADSYVWETDPTLSATDIFNPFASPVTGTMYYVTGTDINDCSNNDSVFVAVYDLPAVNAGDDEAICLGDSVQLDATGAVTYIWDTDPTLSDLGIPDPWANPITLKTYTVTGTDANGCVNEDDVTVTVNSFPTISAGDDVAICLGDSVQLNATGGVLYVWEFDATLSNFVIGDPWATPTVTNTYTVEGTDGVGCSGTAEVTVTVNPLPAGPILYVDSVFIISTIEEGNQWYHESGILVGETNDTLNYLEIGLNGEYWVELTGDFGCSVESNRIDNPIFIDDVGIGEEELNLLVKLFPNPTTGILNVSFEEEVDYLSVFTLDGKVVVSLVDLNAGTTAIDLSELPSGTYLVQLIKDNKVLIKKVIKQ